jgi:hypothetical protein
MSLSLPNFDHLNLWRFTVTLPSMNPIAFIDARAATSRRLVGARIADPTLPDRARRVRAQPSR